MANLYSIFKKELRSYFTSPIAYVIISIFLVLSGYFFYTDLVYFVLWGGADVTAGLWQFLFHDMRLFLLLMIPLVTMRLFAEEKKLGTIELLSTYPIRDIEILFGKFLACLAMLVLMLALAFLYPVLLYPIHSFNIAPVLAGYLGLFLLGCAFISCGMLVSSLTENQIVSAMVTFGLLLLFWFISWNEAAASPMVSKILLRVSLFDHFYDFARGVIDTKDLAFYFLFTGFFLFLTLRSLESRTWRGLR
jgi:ABC-2 type transport system permease protein